MSEIGKSYSREWIVFNIIIIIVYSRAGTFTGDFFPKVLNLGIAAFQGKGNRVGNLVSDFAFRYAFLCRYCA